MCSVVTFERRLCEFVVFPCDVATKSKHSFAWCNIVLTFVVFFETGKLPDHRLRFIFQYEDSGLFQNTQKHSNHATCHFGGRRDVVQKPKCWSHQDLHFKRNPFWPKLDVPNLHMIGGDLLYEQQQKSKSVNVGGLEI